MSVQQNIAAMDKAKAAVLAHPMCLTLEESTHKFTILFPDGDFPVQGVRVDRTAHGLAQALERMEKFWVQSYPGYAA